MGADELGGPIRVLFVEDEEQDVWLALRQLRAHLTLGDHRVVASRDALVEALRDPWDVVLSDFRLPSLSGLEAIQEVRERAPDIPVILLSGAIGRRWRSERCERARPTTC